ncbi:MAG: hypothetical protein ACKO5E_01450 [bacterium]
MEGQIASLEQTMADPAFYKQDKAVIAARNNEMEKFRNELNQAYARWEELEPA